MRLCPMSAAARLLRAPEDYVARMFAFADAIQADQLAVYRDRVGDHLYSWQKAKNEESQRDPECIRRMRAEFEQVMRYVEQYFPYGFVKKKGAKSTPAVRFDALSVGILLCLRAGTLRRPPADVRTWLEGNDFATLTVSSASNVRSRILERVGYVREKLEGRP